MTSYNIQQYLGKDSRNNSMWECKIKHMKKSCENDIEMYLGYNSYIQGKSSEKMNLF